MSGISAPVRARRQPAPNRDLDQGQKSTGSVAKAMVPGLVRFWRVADASPRMPEGTSGAGAETGAASDEDDNLAGRRRDASVSGSGEQGPGVLSVTLNA